MKILVICQYYYPEPFRISDICETLVSMDHEVTVLTGLPNYPEGVIPKDFKWGKKRKENIKGVEVLRCFEIARGKGSIRLFLNYMSYCISATLKSFTLRRDYDVVFVNQLSPVLMAVPGIVLSKLAKKKLVYYILDIWPASLMAGGITDKSMVYRLFSKISNWIYNQADLALVTSNMFSDYLESNFKFPSERIHYLPQYAEEIFHYRKHSFDKDVTNFVFAGNVGVMQSVETIILAANLVKNESIVVHIVGDGSALARCKKLAQVNNVYNVVFHGRHPVEAMPKYYELADAMLVTLKDTEMLSRTVPGKVQSYMAAGKVIIGAINGETKFLIEEAGCGFCCEAEDYFSLADLLVRFKRSQMKEEFSLNSHIYYKNHFDKEQFFSDLENLLEIANETDK